jgi:hypothetical protein
MRTPPSLVALLEHTIKPNAETIAEICVSGGIALVVRNPSDQGRRAAAALGWDGTSAFEMSMGQRKRMAEECEKVGDAVTARWLRRSGPGPGRIFAIAGNGTLLVNFEPGVGYSLEPGSTNRGAA